MLDTKLGVQGSMVQGFVDLEKAFDTVPREMAMATLPWMGVTEAEVRMVEGTDEKTTARAGDWTHSGQRAEPADVHNSTGPHQQEDFDEGCHEEILLCRRPGPGGE